MAGIYRRGRHLSTNGRYMRSGPGPGSDQRRSTVPASAPVSAPSRTANCPFDCDTQERLVFFPHTCVTSETAKVLQSGHAYAASLLQGPMYTADSTRERYRASGTVSCPFSVLLLFIILFFCFAGTRAGSVAGARSCRAAHNWRPAPSSDRPGTRSTAADGCVSSRAIWRLEQELQHGRRGMPQDEAESGDGHGCARARRRRGQCGPQGRRPGHGWDERAWYAARGGGW